MVSHELQTPLTSIQAFTEILLNTPDISTRERQKFLTIIEHESKRLSRLINDLYDVSKSDSDLLKLSRESVDIRNIIQQTIEAMSPLFQKKQIQLNCVLPESAIYSYVDRDRIQQVIINLLSNSVKFCTAGSGQADMTLSRSGTTLRVTVADNGPGIAAEYIHNVFDKFWQSPQQQAQIDGLGLGLTLSKLIIEQHGGEISVESNGHAGCVFSFSLPIQSLSNT